MAYYCEKGSGECDGCGECTKNKSYFCPVCGEEVLEVVYVDNLGNVLGCENCAQIKEPWEMLEDDED